MVSPPHTRSGGRDLYRQPGWDLPTFSIHFQRGKIDCEAGAAGAATGAGAHVRLMCLLATLIDAREAGIPSRLFVRACGFLLRPTPRFAARL